MQVLALGGAKNHLVALADCDFKMAARDIVASFAGCCGQRCMAASVLILVDEEQQGEEHALDGLLSEILETASKLLPGQEGGQVGPLIDPIAKKRSVQCVMLSKPIFYYVYKYIFTYCMYVRMTLLGCGRED